MNFYGDCPHCGATADKFLGEYDQYHRRQFGIACNKCPANVMLLTYPNKEPEREDWDKAQAYWDARA